MKGYKTFTLILWLSDDGRKMINFYVNGNDHYCSLEANDWDTMMDYCNEFIPSNKEWVHSNKNFLILQIGSARNFY